MTELGLALAIVGGVLLLLEAHAPTLGALGVPGTLALAVGTGLAVAGLGGGAILVVISALLIALAAGGTLALWLNKGLAVRRRAVRAGPERLIGHTGTVRSWNETSGKVVVDGALWQARRSWGDDEAEEIHAGDAVVVEKLDGLTLRVRRAEDWELVR
jgi:membrane-bound ClpP family serine protease